MTSTSPPSTRPCPICHSSEVVGYSADYLRCQDCQALYYHQIPDVATLTEVYSGGFFKRLRRRLLVPFRKHHQRATVAQERERNGEIFRNFQEYLSESAPQEPGRFLDVGCNRGFLLEAAKDCGWDVWGVEFSPEQIQPFRNSFPELAEQVHAGSFLELARDLPEAHFQLISAIDVVEHFLEPAPCFRELARLLAPGGHFVVQTPSSALPDAQRDGPAWGELKAAEHMQIFTPENLEALALECGFSSLTVKPGAFDHPNCNFVAVLRR
jgi:SAM-dependent methyltransferase